MILAEVAEQSTTTSFSQVFFYLAIAVAVGYFGWQFYKGTKETGAKTSEAAERSDAEVATDDATAPAEVESTAVDTTPEATDDDTDDEPTK